MKPFAYTRAHTVWDAVAAVSAEPGARYLAGGTEMVNLVREGQESPDRLVDIGDLPLTEVRVHGRGVRIGALAKRVHEHPEVRRRLPVLAEAGLSAASPQVRNVATPGGNLLQRTRCHYFRDVRFPCNRREPGTGCAALRGVNRNNAIFGGSEHCVAVHPSDIAVALTALDAVVHTHGPAGERVIPVEELYRLPGDEPNRETVLDHGELIVAIDVPPTPFAARSHYLKLRDRASFAFALVSVAVALDVRAGVTHDVRIALGGVAPRPWRARAAEDALRGRRFDDDARAAAGEAATTGAKPLPHNEFKVELVRRAVVRALSEVEGR
ncbi:xanthine dehydrogenase YagS FAD-binding subunit [Herbihabitans rhizosphaerae]|uniref:Xanthine dehydrogenase YagS FAD-binding subunit n=1 Tax=Herbihabitans rhizosphaerae TaxID=1872711 RepID=A0A4V2ES59_9PSEU|nr:xanthine dehydrogenase family protein subunit M [Herbihabitans rhizosphaerae]RZS36433.1 xanthine dehydrogenase YagS FAD-binding subunit [Herbihabitans rhizosphaerae]